MKLLHTSDWHIGRTLNGYSLLEEQKYAFEQILAIALAEKVDGVIIAGDLYDSSVPKADFVTTFEQMLREMNLEHQLPIWSTNCLSMLSRVTMIVPSGLILAGNGCSTNSFISIPLLKRP